MKNLYKYIVTAAALLIASSATAQEVIVTDQLIYDRVTGYMATPDQVEQPTMRPTRNLQTIRWEHDIYTWYGAPGLISELLLDNVAFGCGCDPGPGYFTDELSDRRSWRGPMYQLSTVGVGYTKQFKPWLAVGAKASFAAVWQTEYDNITNEPLYNYNRYNIAGLIDVRLSWLRRTNVEMYTSIAAGLCAHIERAAGELWPMWDIAIVGLKVGREFYGFLEVGTGIGGSVRGGFGVRFNGKKQ